MSWEYLFFLDHNKKGANYLKKHLKVFSLINKMH